MDPMGYGMHGHQLYNGGLYAFFGVDSHHIFCCDEFILDLSPTQDAIVASDPNVSCHPGGD